MDSTFRQAPFLYISGVMLDILDIYICVYLYILSSRFSKGGLDFVLLRGGLEASLPAGISPHDYMNLRASAAKKNGMKRARRYSIVLVPEVMECNKMYERTKLCYSCAVNAMLKHHPAASPNLLRFSVQLLPL